MPGHLAGAASAVAVAPLHQEQVERQIRGAHPSGGIESRRDDETDVVTVDHFAREPAFLQQGFEPGPVRAPRESLEAAAGDDPILPDERHDISERANRGHLDEVRQQIEAAAAGEQQAVHELQRHADAGERLVGIAAIGALRVDHGHRTRQLALGLVMIGDDQVDSEFMGAIGRFASRGCRSRPRR